MKRNKTVKYIVPLFKDYGVEFKTKLNSLNLVSIRYNDKIIDEKYNNHLFVLVNYKSPKFISVIKWLRKQSFYETDYPYDDILEGSLHIIVLKIPDQHREAFTHFVNSEYSKMLSEKQAAYYYGKTSERYGIIVKTEDALKSFVDAVNRIYRTDHAYEDFLDVEYDFGLEDEQETFGKTSEYQKGEH
jgi:hypothetical protein